MIDLIEKEYLTPPDNDAIPVLKCFFCEEDVYEGEDYYILNGFYCCENCLDAHFRFTAELPDYEAEKADLEHHERGVRADNSRT